MAKEKNNYQASILEHTEQCIHKLDNFFTLLSKEKLTDTDYLAIERLLQVLIEAGIGFAKQWLKHLGKPVHINAYENMQALCDLDLMDDKELTTWKSMIGLRNVLVHDYLNIDRNIIQAVLKQQAYHAVIQFIQYGVEQWIPAHPMRG